VVVTLKVLLFALAVIEGLEAQAMPELNIKSSPSPVVTLTPFSPSQFPVFKDVYDPRSTNLGRASFVVSNGADKAIIGIGVKWTLTDSAGRESTYSNRSHSFQVRGGRPLALPRGQLLAGPETFVPEAILLHPEGGVIGVVPDDRIIARFSGAAEIAAEVDCIIFQDGEVVGPDQLGLVNMIRDRREASQEVLKRVEQARAKGQDPTEVLHQILTTPILGGDSAARLELVFARELLHARHLDAHIEYMQSIPAPPLFYRKDVGPLWR
jgi:hypothetical protein